MNLLPGGSQIGATANKIKKGVGLGAFFILSPSHTKTKYLPPSAHQVDVVTFVHRR